MASEVERVALSYPDVSLVKAVARSNPITGQHVELSAQPATDSKINIADFKKFMNSQLPSHMVPRKIVVEEVEVGHRFKRL